MSRNVSRPWAVMWRYAARSGRMTTWRVHGTYTTRDRAQSGALKISGGNWRAETHIVGPDEPRVGPPEALRATT